MTRVGGIEELSDALLTNREVRRDANRRLFDASTLADAEVREAYRVSGLHDNARNTRCRRRRNFQRCDEVLKLFFGTLRVNHDAIFAVEYPTHDPC